MSIIMEAVTGIRTIRGELNLSPSLELKAYIKTLSKDAGGSSVRKSHVS